MTSGTIKLEIGRSQVRIQFRTLRVFFPNLPELPSVNSKFKTFQWVRPFSLMIIVLTSSHAYRAALRVLSYFV